MSTNVPDDVRIRASKEIAVRMTAKHILPMTVSDMAVLRELTGFGTALAREYDELLAKLSKHGFSLAICP